jgi:hypothetical protein
MPDEPGWLTPEQEAKLDEIAKNLPVKTPAQREESARRCEEAKRYRLTQEFAAQAAAELPPDVPDAKRRQAMRRAAEAQRRRLERETAGNDDLVDL